MSLTFDIHPVFGAVALVFTLYFVWSMTHDEEG